MDRVGKLRHSSTHHRTITKDAERMLTMFRLSPLLPQTWLPRLPSFVYHAPEYRHAKGCTRDLPRHFGQQAGNDV